MMPPVLAWCRLIYRTTKGNMNKAFGIALLAAGVVLLVMGFNASDSFASDVSRFFTGSPTDKAVWLILGGIVAGIVGLILTVSRTKVLK
jgi:hypothetical protein